MNLSGLLKNKKTLYVGGAAALGVGALWAYTRGGGGFAGGGSSSGGSAAPQAFLDSSAQDMSQALDQAEQSWSADLREFSGSLQDVMDKLNTLPPAGTGNPTGNPTPTPAPTTPGGTTSPSTPAPPVVPKPAAKPAPEYTWTTAYRKTNTPWNSTLSGIAKHYHTTVSALLKLNPKIKNPNVIGSHQQIRIK